MRIFDAETLPTADQILLAHLKKTVTAAKTLKDPEKIAADLDAKRAALLEKTAVRPIMARVFHICAAAPDSEICHFSATNLKNGKINEKQMLRGFAEYMAKDISGDLCGYNIEAFDVPLLACAYIRNDLDVPTVLKVNLGYLARGSYDLFKKFGRQEKLQTLALSLGLKPLLDKTGADVYTQWKDGDAQSIADHCADDVRCCQAIFNKVWGQVAA